MPLVKKKITEALIANKTRANVLSRGVTSSMRITKSPVIPAVLMYMKNQVSCSRAPVNGRTAATRTFFMKETPLLEYFRNPTTGAATEEGSSNRFEEGRLGDSDHGRKIARIGMIAHPLMNARGSCVS